MTALIAAFHCYALAIGFMGIGLRTISLGDRTKERGLLNRVFLGDNLWGLAAALWLITGFLRAFGGFEKGTSYYLSNP